MTFILSLLGIIPGVGPILAAVIGFLASCRVCLIALLAAAVFLTGTVYGHRKASKACREADILMQLAAKQRDEDIAIATADLVKKRLIVIETENKELNAKVEQYENEIIKSGNECKSPDRARRLRDIR